MGQACVCMKVVNLEKLEREALAMPPFVDFRESALDPKDVQRVAECWREIMSGKAKPFLIAKEHTPTLTPLVFFYNT